VRALFRDSVTEKVRTVDVAKSLKLIKAASSDFMKNLVSPRDCAKNFLILSDISDISAYI